MFSDLPETPNYNLPPEKDEIGEIFMVKYSTVGNSRSRIGN